jgi:aspartyl-tRNA(Asn)/glutamyl-tRNA(Gln) amidotransferase subunit A
MELCDLTIHEAHDLLRARQISSVELTRSVLERIHHLDPKLRAYITVAEDQALKQAALADERFHTGQEITPLTGIPFSAKDSIITEGMRTTCASRILENYIPPYHATAIQRLIAAGAVLLGKNNMDEFGMGSSCENSAFFPTHNPWDVERVPGGSSGGSAAAVATSMTLFALGGDTGGSIRMPASFCGIVGLKPTYGRVSRCGLVALASSFDTIGPMTRDVHDAALVLTAIAGADPLDSTTLQAPVPVYSLNLGKDIRGLRIGIPKEYFVEGMEPGVALAIQEAIRVYQSLGAEIREVSLPNTRFGLPVYYLILFAEASANLARFDGVRFGRSERIEAGDVVDLYLRTRQEGFGEEVKRRIMLGAFTLSAGYYDAYYRKAQKGRALIRRDFEAVFTKVDALIAPVCPTTAFKLGEKVNDPLAMYLSDVYVVGVNPAGVPALALPCGFANGLPVGMQLIGDFLSEELLFQLGYAYQQNTPWHHQRPGVLTEAA